LDNGVVAETGFPRWGLQYPAGMASPLDLPPWTALVVEDEPRLRKAMVAKLRAASRTWEAILEAEDADGAMAALANASPDVAFLDIRLPGISGLELARQLPAKTRLVFVTAYDAHAIEAFEAGAVDYLLKPVQPERLALTLSRLGSQGPAPVDLPALLKALRVAPAPPSPEPLQWITASSGRRLHWIAVEDVLCFQADQKLTRVVCREGSYFIETPLKALAQRLDPARFQQVHRSVLVNLRAVAWVEKREGGGGLLHLKGHEAQLPVSAPFLKTLRGMG
jgi:DNA-binding LytR/AlgR family response regulator